MSGFSLLFGSSWFVKLPKNHRGNNTRPLFSIPPLVKASHSRTWSNLRALATFQHPLLFSRSIQTQVFHRLLRPQPDLNVRFPKKKKKSMWESAIDCKKGRYVIAVLNSAALISIKASWWLIRIMIEDNQTGADGDAFEVLLRFSSILNLHFYHFYSYHYYYYYFIFQACFWWKYVFVFLSLSTVITHTALLLGSQHLYTIKHIGWEGQEAISRLRGKKKTRRWVCHKNCLVFFVSRLNDYNQSLQVSFIDFIITPPHCQRTSHSDRESR